MSSFTITSIPSSSASSRWRHCSKVSLGSRLPPGNSQRPPRCDWNGRCVISSLPPRKTRPAATSMLGRDEFTSPPDALVDETQLFHFLRVEEIAAVEHNGVRERIAGTFQVELLEFGPFSGHNERIALFSHFVHVIDISHIAEDSFGLAHRLGIVDAQLRALALQPFAEIDRGRESHVVSVLFESQAKHTNLLVLQDPECLLYFFDEA